MVRTLPPSVNSKVYQMTEFQSENSTIWHSLELAEGGIADHLVRKYDFHKASIRSHFWFFQGPIVAGSEKEHVDLFSGT